MLCTVVGFCVLMKSSEYIDIILCGDSYANRIGPHVKAPHLTHSLMTKYSTEGVHHGL